MCVTGSVSLAGRDRVNAEEILTLCYTFSHILNETKLLVCRRLVENYFVAVKVMTMVIVFIVCWGPYATLSMIGVLGFSKVKS